MSLSLGFLRRLSKSNLVPSVLKSLCMRGCRCRLQKMSGIRSSGFQAVLKASSRHVCKTRPERLLRPC